MRLFVYYDEKYPTQWVSREASKQIVDFLNKYGFKQVNASELRKVIEDGIRGRLTEDEIVIVFSQDVVPATLLDNPNSPTQNSLLRKFLNSGHTVVWVGDIPLSYVGTAATKIRIGDKSRQSVLGLNQPINKLSSPRFVRPIGVGMQLGLPSWHGQRPLQPTPQPQGYRPQVGPLAIHPFDQSSTYHGFFAKYVPTNSPDISGFIRIYDMVIDKLTEEQLFGILTSALRYNIYPIVLYGALNRLTQRIDTKFNTLKSEVEEVISPKLDEILEKIEPPEIAVLQKRYDNLKKEVQSLKSKISKYLSQKEELIFYDDFKRFRGWEQYGEGKIELSTDVAYKGKYSLKKDENPDPNGGFKKLPKKIYRKKLNSIIFSGWIYRPSKFIGGSADRLAIEDENFNGYGFFAGHGDKPKLAIEKWTKGEAEKLKEIDWRSIEDEWYQFKVVIGKDKLDLYIYDKEENEIEKIEGVVDDEYSSFDRVAVHGGFVYYVGYIDVKVVK